VTERQRRLLNLLTRAYIETGKPVPSGWLAGQLGVSPATVRYDLADLEAAGLVEKPHASAGRVPTRRGFRQYALAQLPPQPLPPETLSRLARVLAQSGNNWPQLTAQMAARLSGYPTIVRLSPPERALVIEVHLSDLGGGRLLAVAVLEGGRLLEGIISFDLPAEEGFLEQAERWLHGPYPLAELSERHAPTPQLAQLARQLVEAFGTPKSERYVEGLGAMLNEPEARDPDFVRRTLDLLESLPGTPVIPAGGLDVRVGDVEGISLVQAGFHRTGRSGELTMIGPLRMHYRQALSVAHSLSHALEGSLV